ncbi:GNAT family N-acetyltransferase [Ruminococcaceae bacterium OttesenSCG-928-N02]|nr:GNAT family N-acetyltransferase [Ruminococcaceae bacterium OttesenSCG-928-N02]
MELKKWAYAYTSDLATYANNKKIADNLRDSFPYPYTQADARQFIEFCMGAPESRELNRAIVFGGRAIGSVGLRIGDDIYAKSAEIGYWLAEEYWGHGFATQAVKEMCRIAFEQCGMERVYAHVFSYNTASCKVLERCAFAMEGVLRNAVYKNGQLYSAYLYSKIR